MHQSVLLSEIVEYLRPARDDGTLVDATVGLGGHAEALARRAIPRSGSSASIAIRRRWPHRQRGWRDSEIA